MFGSFGWSGGAGGGDGPTLTIGKTSILSSATGVVAQLTSNLVGATFSETPDVANVSINAAGAVTLGTALGVGGTRVLNAVVTGTLAGRPTTVSVQFTLTGVVGVPTLSALTLGAATLTSAMNPGDVVATISGKTAGSVVAMTGLAFTSGKLAVNAGGTAIVVGAAGPLAVGDTTGTYSLNEALAGATNTPLVSGAFASITVTAASGISPVSADARGIIITLASTPGTEYLNQAETIVRSGYDATATLGAWNEPALIRRRKRAPATLATFDANAAMFSKTLLAGDALVGRPGFVNNSTRTPPAIEGRWTVPHQIVVTTTDSMAANFECALTRNGLAIAAAKFIWSDGTNPDVSVIISAPSKRTHALTGHVSHEWRSGVVNIASLANGLVTRRCIAYGHHGQVLDSSAGTLSHEFSPGFIRKHATFQTPYAYIKNGVTGGAASLTPATARGTPFPDTIAGVLAAYQALTTLNSSANGFSGMDGGVIRLSNGGAGLTLGSPAVTTTQLIAGIRIEPDPVDYAGTATLTLTNWAPKFGNTALPQPWYAIVFNKFDNIRGAGATSMVAGASTSTRLNVWFRGGSYDANTPSAAVFPVSNGWAWFEDNTFLGLSGASSSHLLGGANSGVSLLGVTGGSCNNIFVCTHMLIGTHLENCRLFPQSSQLGGSLLDACSFTKVQPGASGTIISLGTGFLAAGRWFYGRNTLIENIRSAEGNAYASSSDGATHNARMFFRGCAFPGYLDANRHNAFYVDVDSDTDPRVHDFCGYEGSVVHMLPSKGDKFHNRANSYTGWLEFGSGVNQSGNFHVGVWGLHTDADTPDSYGTGCAEPATRAAPLDPGFLAPAIPIALNGADGAGTSNALDYRFKSASRGIGVGESAAIGAVAYIPGVRWDMLGNDLTPGTIKTTPGPFAGLY